MDNSTDRLQKLLNAIDFEKKHDEAFFHNLKATKSQSQLLSEGYIWQNIDIRKRYYTIGEYIECEIYKTKQLEVESKFTEGAIVALTNTLFPEVIVKATLTTVRSEYVKVMLHADNMEDLDAFAQGVTTLELLYDDKSYKIMEEAIHNVMKSKDELISSLRSLMLSPKVNNYSLPVPTDIVEQCTLLTLNESQKEAIMVALSSPDLAIIHGPPGTGKTTTLVELIKLLVAKDKKILVCAPSNNAVDLLTSKLQMTGVNILRIGNISRMNDNILSLTIEEKVRDHQQWTNIKKVKKEASDILSKASKFKRSFTYEDRAQRNLLKKEARELQKWAIELEKRLIDEIIDSSQVIATTLIGASNRLINKLCYDTVIIDEASQALEPECWNAILHGKKVILAGDPLQLPPVVKSKEAKALHFDSTIIDVLYNQIYHTSLLKEQYRMNDMILGFPNLFFYKNLLTSNEKNKTRVLPGDNHPFVFIDTAGCGFDEQASGHLGSYKNEGEFFIIREHLLQNFERMIGHSIGIISPYSSQVKLIKSEIEKDEELQKLGIVVNSIDGFQGQEKDIIYISLVRNNTEGQIGFLTDERRINVAMTRAKMKLVIVGDSSTLCQFRFFNTLIDYVHQVGAYDSAWSYMSYQ